MSITSYEQVFEMPWRDKVLNYLSGDGVNKTFGSLTRGLLVPLLAVLIFLGLWNVGAKQVVTSLGELPGPAAVWEQTQALYQEHSNERDKEAAFNERLQKRIDKAIAAGKSQERIDRMKARSYTGPATFFDQIWTSLLTVMTGFVIASLIAIPLGIVIGMSQTLYQAFNPIIQVFKPVSPLAWLPLVTMVVSAVYVTQDPMFSKSFLTSAITVTLCCLWPTIINTAVGVSGVSKDLINVSRVLRLSLGIGWMVLIAAEMLAQNPGLGKFVWDEFQNGSSNSLARIMVAVLVIGFIGFLLDRAMLMLQRSVNWDKTAILR